ncbi:MAG: Gfo/Idh/MocA family oxidoreductase [Betaproteobacteria bacterium]|nr:Gfo/Idh/MocA family oxidoreductase [Betaproteobacteria bacterium]
MKSLVVGYGSIGTRHARLLTDLGCRTAVVSKREVNFPIRYASLRDAIQSESPEYVVLSNETSGHYETLTELAATGFTGTVLVEKPLFGHFQEFPPYPFQNVFVAYNLRFHPIIQRLRNALEGQTILSVQGYVGQYLPEWRPSTDYRTCYSARAELGGGVLRDLSHELDYLLWILGGWRHVAAVGGHYSPLEINSDDVYSLMLVTPACPVVSLQINYLDRKGRRLLIINTVEHTYTADLVAGTLEVDKTPEVFSVDRDHTYRKMHEALISDDTSVVCSLQEGLETLRLIDAAEESAKRREWVNR